MIPPTGSDSDLADKQQPSPRQVVELPASPTPGATTQPSPRTRRERVRAQWPWWSVASLLLLALFALTGTAGSLAYAFRRPPAAAWPTAVVVTVTRQLWSTPVAVTDVPPTSVSQPDVTRYVRVVGTQGLSLRIRTAPSTKAETVKLLPDGTRLLVTGDGQQADGSLWWPVRDPSDNTEGWAVSTYLVPDVGP
jgi:Bacterial SH3 domain